MHRRGCVFGVGIVCAGLVLLTGGMLPAAGLAWAATEGAHEGGLINLDRSLIVQVLNFVILLLILQRLLYKPFLAKMQERTAAIQKSLEEAAVARADAARLQAENEARLRAAHAEAAAIRAQTLREAAEEQKRLVDAARAEAQRLLDGARAQMEADVRRVRDELRREVAELATLVAEKLVRRSLRDEDHRRLLADAIARVGD